MLSVGLFDKENIFTAGKRSLRRLCFHRCLSVHREWDMCGGGMHGRGACMAGGMHGKGACMVEGIHDRGHAWQGGMHGREHAWQGACMAGCETGGLAWQER